MDAGKEFEMAELFEHSPNDFDSTRHVSWEDPCWLCADVVLSPRTLSLRQKFVFNLMLAQKIDAFAKTAWQTQLWVSYRKRFSLVQGPYANDWFQALMRYLDELKQSLNDTGCLFPQPCRFLRRAEFVNVDLATILKEQPEAVFAYLSFEKGSYCEYCLLRIHTKLPLFGTLSKALWFQKRLPDILHPGDILSWFRATIGRLPKKHRPLDVDVWVKRLLDFEPQLAVAVPSGDKSWTEKPKVVIVFGSVGQVGYRSMFHIERRDINRIVRRGDVVNLDAKVRYHYADGTHLEFEYTFYLIGVDEVAAEHIERHLLRGERIHFGLDKDIFGLVSRRGESVHAINVSPDRIHELCVPPGFELRLRSRVSEKHKRYELIEVRACHSPVTNQPNTA
jgi:hypothetical protein